MQAGETSRDRPSVVDKVSFAIRKLTAVDSSQPLAMTQHSTVIPMACMV